MTEYSTRKALRMREVRKQSYRYMKALVREYGLRDEAELFECLLQLLSEVTTMQGAMVSNGEQYWRQVISQWLSAEHRDTDEDYALVRDKGWESAR